MTPLLSVEMLRKDFAGRTVLNIALLELQAGQRYVVTGDNGAGKSTLLRILAGLEKAEVGRFAYAGMSVDITRYPSRLRNDIIYVHQHPYLFHTTVAANIAYGLKARGAPRETRERTVADAMRWAGVEHLQAVPPQKLSGGEKQRVALARAQVLHPKVWLLDEPTANLDAEARGQIVVLLNQLADSDTCVVIACHDQEIIGLKRTVRLHLEGGDLRHVQAVEDGQDNRL